MLSLFRDCSFITNYFHLTEGENEGYVQNKMNPVVHFDMPYDDRERIAKFYQTVFGWQTQMLGEDMGNYVVVTTANRDVKQDLPRGAIGGGFYKKTPGIINPYPSIVIGVDDIKEAMKKVKESGGKVLGEPMEIPGVGTYGGFLDTEGNRVSLLQPLPMQPKA
jgi:predicted enzyme related to lactoylglutathione lyase